LHKNRIMHTQKMVSVLGIFPSSDDRTSLKQIVRHSKWNLGMVEALRPARPLIDELAAGVVISDSHLPDACWQDVLRELQCRRFEPVLIVASRLADDALWAEVLNLGGSDVLAMPLQEREVLRSVSLAWRQWQDRLVTGERPAGKVITAGARAWW
jgi:DNA-binding response OmpR family regulator